MVIGYMVVRKAPSYYFTEWRTSNEVYQHEYEAAAKVADCNTFYDTPAFKVAKVVVED